MKGPSNPTSLFNSSTEYTGCDSVGTWCTVVCKLDNVTLPASSCVSPIHVSVDKIGDHVLTIDVTSYIGTTATTTLKWTVDPTFIDIVSSAAVGPAQGAVTIPLDTSEAVVVDAATNQHSRGNTASFSFHLPLRPAVGETVTISCTPSGPVSLTPTKASFTAQTYDGIAAGDAPPSLTITVDPYYSNDQSPAAVRSYSIACSASSVGSGTRVYASPRVHNVNGTISNSIFPVWQAAYVLLDTGEWMSVVDVNGGKVNLALTVSTSTVVALVGDVTYRGVASAPHFNTTATRVMVGGVPAPVIPAPRPRSTTVRRLYEVRAEGRHSR